MIRRGISRYGYRASVAIMTVALCAVVLFLLTVAIPDVMHTAIDHAPRPVPTRVPAPTPGSAMALSPIGIDVPANAECSACHLTSTGTVGTKPIPRLAHPLTGWSDCTACHAHNRLVETAPGHSGLHKDDCLVCHQAPDAAATESAAPRPHHIVSDKPCISCHGATAEAPLPTDMAGRTNCWVCHAGTEFNELFGTPEPSPAASPVANALGARLVGGVATPRP
jgi:hypothetical protein